MRNQNFKVILQGEIEKQLVIKKLRAKGITKIGITHVEDVPYKQLVLELAKSHYRQEV